MPQKISQVTSETLYESYTGLHDSIYDDQMVTVSGIAIYVGPDSYGLPCIELGNPVGNKTWVGCVVPDMGGVQTDDRVVITGNSEGFTQGRWS
ncbi:hypothetical protein MK904_11875 [Loigolactobacillus coryniformis]|uniref:hypothetical protein n=1 Tax=Loigolactobacillus coryniformis TaxID=1610 RepID=UPI0023422443|nr:hypothetical protein [Loigolactobacillus coryniformis]MDC4186785.1 hypothetical protein [Loigolactobacillus coryniformis]